MFLPIVLGMYFLTKESYRNVLLLAASLFFYAWGEPVYVLVMILSIVINYICGLKIGTEDETKRKRALVGGIVINLALLGVFKYSGFFMETAFADWYFVLYVPVDFLSGGYLPPGLPAAEKPD